MTAFMDQVRADLTFADMDAHTSRTPGLSMSALGGCQRRGAFLLTGAEETDVQDKWTAMRGTAIHTYILGARHRANPTLDIPELFRHVPEKFEDLRPYPPPRPLRLPGLPEIPGEFDEYDPDDDSVTDYKSCEPEAADWHRRHGPFPEHAMQTAGYAVANGASKARVVYVPTTGTFDDWVVCDLDVNTWLDRLHEWLITVADAVEAGTDLPKGKPYDWCEKFCPYFTACRGEDVPSASEPITDPTIIAAAAEYLDAHEQYAAAEKRKKAARTLLADARGLAGNVRVGRQPRKGREGPDMDRIRGDYERAGATVPMTEGTPGWALSVKAVK